MRAQINFNKPFVILTSQPKAKVQAQIDAVSFSLSLSPSLALSLLSFFLFHPRRRACVLTRTPTKQVHMHARAHERTHTRMRTPKSTLCRIDAHTKRSRDSLLLARALSCALTHTQTHQALYDAKWQAMRTEGDVFAWKRLRVVVREVCLCVFFPQSVFACMYIHKHTH